MRAFDTNVLVRLVMRDDAEQSRQADSFVENAVHLSVSRWGRRSVYVVCLRVPGRQRRKRQPALAA